MRSLFVASIASFLGFLVGSLLMAWFLKPRLDRARQIEQSAMNHTRANAGQIARIRQLKSDATALGQLLERRVD